MFLIPYYRARTSSGLGSPRLRLCPRPTHTARKVIEIICPYLGGSLDFPCFYSVYIFPRRLRYTHALTHDIHKNIYNPALLLIQCMSGQEFEALLQHPNIRSLAPAVAGMGKRDASRHHLHFFDMGFDMGRSSLNQGVVGEMMEGRMQSETWA